MRRGSETAYNHSLATKTLAARSKPLEGIRIAGYIQEAVRLNAVWLRIPSKLAHPEIKLT